MKLRYVLSAAAILAFTAAPAQAQTKKLTFFTAIGDIALPIAPGPNGSLTVGMALGDVTAINGLNAPTAPSLITTGGTSSTSASAGGAARLHGGLPGATGVGGDATVRGGIGGSTSGAGGLASITGGAGTAGNSAGGLARAVGGAGQGSAAGGAALLTGGVGGATGAGGAATIAAGAGGATSGSGGVASLAGGAGSAGNANGGDVNIAGGAANGSGVNGVIRETGVRLVSQGAQDTEVGSVTLTAAAILTGIIQGTPVGAANYTLPLATAMDTALPTSAASDSFDFSLINTSGGANTITVLTNTGWTLVGAVTAAQNVSGRFRARKTGAGAWTLYRLS